MQTARIIPFMRRRTEDEFARRHAEVLSAMWFVMLWPLAVCLSIAGAGGKR